MDYLHSTFFLGPLLVVVYLYLSVRHQLKFSRAPLVVLASWLLYVLFFNYLANLTFSTLHLNILARMWQQASVAGYAVAGAGAAMALEYAPQGKVVDTGVSLVLLLASAVPIHLNYKDMDR